MTYFDYTQARETGTSQLNIVQNYLYTDVISTVDVMKLHANNLSDDLEKQTMEVIAAVEAKTKECPKTKTLLNPNLNSVLIS